MKTISILNKLFKFADDVSLLVPQCTDCPIDVELENVESWSNSTKLTLNTKKTKEIIFYKSKVAKRKFNIEKLGNIERIEETTLLGVILNSDLSWFPHVRHILSQITQRYYLLVQLKNMAIEKSMLNEIFLSLIISRIRYTIEAISGNLNTSEIDMIDSILKKAQRWGISSVTYSYRDIALDADLNLVKKNG